MLYLSMKSYLIEVYNFIFHFAHSLTSLSYTIVMCSAAGKEDQQLPYLLYLQGGPGFESPRPTEASGWISKACEEYRLVLLDQACHTIQIISLYFGISVSSH